MKPALTGTIRRGVAVAALCCAAVGCQSHNGPSTTSDGAAPGSGSAAADNATPLDVCSMLSPQDLSAVLGTAVPGKPRGNDRRTGAGCSWQNPSTEESVTVEIGHVDSALNNSLPAPVDGLPEPTPGPDGMRFTVGGTVQFAVNNRLNSVQVAVLRLSPDQRNSAAVNLARKIVPQVPQ